MKNIASHSIDRRDLIGGAMALLMALSLIIAAPQLAAADSAGKPDQFVRDFGNSAIAVLADQSLVGEDRRQAFRQLLTEGFDVQRIGRFVLGRYWLKASDKQRADYIALFEDTIVTTYSRQLEAYSGEMLAVEGVRQQDEKTALVRSRIQRKEGGPILVDWRLMRADASWRIVDVVVEGVSMALTQRSEYAAVIRGSGGQIDGLLAKLREKNEQVKSASVGKSKSTL